MKDNEIKYLLVIRHGERRKNKTEKTLEKARGIRKGKDKCHLSLFGFEREADGKEGAEVALHLLIRDIACKRSVKVTNTSQIHLNPSTARGN